MSNPTSMIRRDADAGLLFTTHGSEATIVGCTAMSTTHLDIPPIVKDGSSQFQVTGIGEAAFSYMTELKTIAIPSTLTRIGHGAFEASGLTEIRLHSGVADLSPYAFFNCVHLSHVGLPNSGMIHLPREIFGGCTALQRGDVENLHFVPEEDVEESGLPAMPHTAPGSWLSSGPAADFDGSPAGLLRQGRQLESEQRPVEAAEYYVQAHRLRPAVSRNPNLEAKLAELQAITEAEYRLGVLLKLGLAPEKDMDGSTRPTAVELLRSVADTGSIADAAYHLGDLYAGGYGMQPNRADALKYLKKAANLGHERACLDLAYIYLDGTLDHASLRAAHLYFEKCAAMNGPYAVLARDGADQAGKLLAAAK
ncbi:MAG: leucine-rich repeat protein [Clostridia bacterium]|nr:leucine-rich repeat protein [Clostridia bacterium]